MTAGRPSTTCPRPDPTSWSLPQREWGGIQANNTYPAEFLTENLRIQVNLMDAAQAVGVARLLYLGSTTIYPRVVDQPIKESSLLTGPLEPTSEGYAIAKIAGIRQVQAHRRQYGASWISAMSTNLYGPGANFDPRTAHVLPALIRRFHEATVSRSDQVVLWGSGRPRREFLHTDDLGAAVVRLLEVYDEPEHINVGFGRDIAIRELAELIAEVVGFTGEIVQDPSKPDGAPGKLLDVSRIKALGWEPQLGLRSGIERTHRWFVENIDVARLGAEPANVV